MLYARAFTRYTEVGWSAYLNILIRKFEFDTNFLTGMIVRDSASLAVGLVSLLHALMGNL